ncbi:hypothetical protein GOV08_05620 [Candidatus Woesearchaeota archaeon]|nr:hypothetical protein [Candidatus Woesearchaeota archaeon]
MFDKKFTAKYEISKEQYKKVFLELCKNAKNIKNLPKEDPVLLKEKILHLESEAQKKKKDDFITQKLKAKKNIPKPNPLEIKSQLDAVKKIHDKLKRRKNAPVKKLEQVNQKIKELRQKLKQM